MFKLLLLLAVVPAILARTPVRECGGGLPLPTAVFFGGRTNPCLAAPCAISRSSGSGVTYVDFTTRVAASTIMPQVRATAFGVTFTQELPASIRDNPCQILTQGSCPLRAGEQAAYRLELPIESSTPQLISDTEITLFGGADNHVIFCYRLQTRVVA
jgi:Niemann-Pick C2 protein